MGDFSGLEEIHSNCGKATQMGTMNRGFTVLSMLPINSNQFNLRMWLII
jgi:hypothetical protein